MRLTIFVDRLGVFFFCYGATKKKEKDTFEKKFLFIFYWLLTSFTG